MKERIKGAFTKRKILHFLKMALFVVALSLILLSLLGTVAHATGLVDDTINAENLYSKYPLSNYQLDFYVDNSWSWLPWNWLDGIGKSVQYGLYCITNFVWTISLYLSNATGYVVQEAYKLDFINDMADSIGQSIQTLAGVTENGFSSTGFYVGFLLLIILIVGLYVAYTGLIKRETSKALHAVINFVVVFVLSASFIAYAPDYIKKINEFSSDISTASLDLGTKIMLPNSDSEGKDSVDLIRDSLFSIQVEQPWLLLQFGNSNAEEIGTDRVEALVSVSPEDEDGKTREEVVKTEIEDNDNNNLTIPQVVNRLGMVFFLLFFNLGITIFVFLLTGMMLFSQILFIIFAMFLPISFLLSMIPSYESMAKQAIVRVFNTIMTRAGITLIVTVAFSISSMFYNISTDYPFFMVAFLQIVCFAGIYMKLGDLMSMFSLNAGDSQNMGRRIFRRPYLFMRHRARRMEHRIARAVSAGGISGGVAGAVAGSAVAGKRAERKNTASKENRGNTTSSMGQRAGSKVGAVLDTKNKVKDKANAVKENIKDMPTQTAYAVYSAKEKAKSSVSDFKRGMVQEQQSRQTGRLEKQEQHRQNIADKRMELQKAQEARQRKTDGSATTGATRPHERPATASTIPKPSAEKMQEVKRPATATTSKASEPVKTNVVKERPLSSGASDKKATQPAQPVHRQNVEKVVSQETRQNYKAERTTKKQTFEQSKRTTEHTEKNRNLVTKKGQKKKMKLKHIALIGSLFPILFSIVLFFGVLISADSDDENSNFSSGITGMNLSAEVLKHQPMVEKYARENGISEYVNVLLAIIQVESGGTAEDVMQSSESLGLPPNSLDTESSIKQGCKYFASLLSSCKNQGIDDLNVAIQSYNYGGGYVGYVAGKGKKHTFNLAESFAREKSGGKKVTYTNPIAVAKNGGWRYQYGNQFYVELVNQYLTVPQVSGELAQKVMNEALKYQGWKYVYGGSNPNTSFDCSGLTQWCYGKAGISLPRTAQAQYDATQHLPLSQAKAGDLVFFHSTYNAGSYVTHVGILVSPTQMYHAGDPIGYADLSSSYWQQHLIGAGRVKQ